MSIIDFRVIRQLVLRAIAQAERREWTVQGFGVARLYLADVGRIHVWHSALRNPGVSLIHDHAWDLESLVISGLIVNRRYEWTPAMDAATTHTHWAQRLITGEGGGLVEAPSPGYLRAYSEEAYGPGDMYRQQAREIHSTHPDDYTVTLMTREEAGQGHRATVFWPYGQQWGTAEPRPATVADLDIALGGVPLPGV